MRYLKVGSLCVLGLIGLVAPAAPQDAPRDCTALSPATELPLDTACPGPFEVARAAYDSRADHPEGIPIDGVSFPVDRWAAVSYPKGFPRGPAPLVLLIHGNRGTCGVGFNPDCQNPVPHHEGFQYLIDHLASHGFVAVSVNANRVNSSGFDRVPERGHLLLDHLKHWRRWAQAPSEEVGEVFVGHVDLTRIGLVGHSRGGEAVVAAYALNRELEDPFSIGAVLSIAPTDKRGLSIAGVPYHALVPACDGDVLDYRGARFFDRALAAKGDAPAHLSFVLGANHNHFNALWDTDGGCTGLELIQRAAQERVAQTTATAFLRRYLFDETELRDAFTGDTPTPAAPEVPRWVSYVDPVRLDLDRFDHPLGAPNALGGESAWSSLRDPHTCGPDLERACSTALVNEASALALQWFKPDAAYETEIPPEHGDVSAYTHLALRAAQNPDHTRFDALNPDGQVAHFRVGLVDRDGNEAWVSTRALGGVPFPVGSQVRDPQSGRFLLRNLLTTLRFPLAAFEGLDPARVAALRLRFDDTPNGALYLTDFQFSR